MAIRILQFGTTGQLGLEISRLAEACSNIVLRGVTAEDADFRHPKQVVAAVRSADAIDVVVNTVAYTAVDKAESAGDLARLINATSVAAMADACAARNIPLIHISTDYSSMAASWPLYRVNHYQPAWHLWPHQTRGRACHRGRIGTPRHCAHVLTLQYARHQLRKDYAAPRKRARGTAHC
jgi:dTDP-4-dehydrorhamnose reductase